jgi:hypothetical protein
MMYRSNVRPFKSGTATTDCNAALMCALSRVCAQTLTSRKVNDLIWKRIEPLLGVLSWRLLIMT